MDLIINDKIKEAEFFLFKINLETKNEQPELFDISCYYSAFLSASYSVYDYALTHANDVFKLGLYDEYWDWKNFHKKAKSQKKIRALQYVKWWNARKKNDNKWLIGKAFSSSRRINIHKGPSYKISVEGKIVSEKDLLGGKIPKDSIPGFRVCIQLEPFLQVKGVKQLKLQKACSNYLSIIKKFSEDHYKIINKLKNSV